MAEVTGKRTASVLLLYSVLLMQIGFTQAADTVRDTVACVVGEPSGTVVSLGLSDYMGVKFFLSRGSNTISETGAAARADNRGFGDTFGPGARLQYTVFGFEGSSFKITARVLEEEHAEKTKVGIYAISPPPTTGSGEDAISSGAIGSIVRNGVGEISDYRVGNTDYEDIEMKFLQYDSSVELISGIDGGHSWTGTDDENGARIFYELTEPMSAQVRYTLSAE